MSLFCVPKHLVDKIKNSALSKEADIAKLYDMTSQERRDFFTKVTDVETGEFINTKFEQAMVSKQKTALLDWAKSVFSPMEKVKPVYKNVLDKINLLQEEAFMNQKEEDVFLEDLVTERLGISISKQEMQDIIKRAGVIQEKQAKLGDNLNNPEFRKENIEFYSSMKEMNDYLLSKTPSNPFKVLTGTIGRGMMLASIKSPTLNIGSNMIVGTAEAIVRRIANGKILGGNNGLASSYIRMANEIYYKTGFDISRMQGMEDMGASGSRLLGDTVNTQGGGAVNKVGRVVEDIVFKNLMGAPDAFFAGAHFADSINLQSMGMANGDKALASKYMIDAMRVNPQTDEGKLLRAQGILDAQVATWTNDTWASKFTSSVRKVFNDVFPNARIGDYLFPFVKTPANVIATGIDYAGGGAVKGVIKLAQLYKAKDFSNKSKVQEIIRDVTRSGLGMIAALMLAMNTDDDDFAGVYDPRRAQIEGLRNSRDNSIRVGNTWISTDWLGPIQVPFTAMMYARKYGKAGELETTFQYLLGTGSKVLDLPVVGDIIDSTKQIAQKKNETLSETLGNIGNYVVSESSARLIPSIFSDIAKTLDDNERVSETALEAVQAKLPWLRNNLPVKRNVLGDALTTENPVVSLLFGSRVRTSKEDSIIKEISDVSNETEKSLSFTDWKKSSSTKLAQFKNKIGAERYKDATIEYGVELKKLLKKQIESSEYKKLPVEKKLVELNKLDTIAQENIFTKYKFKYVTPKK